MKNNTIIILMVVLLVIVFFIGRSSIPKRIHGEISTGMPLSGVLELLDKSMVIPYACNWELVSEKRAVATRNCAPPIDDVFMKSATSDLNIRVIFKGLGLDQDFDVLFDGNQRVISVGGLSGR